MSSFCQFFESLPNLSNSYWYPFQLQNSSSSSVSCFIALPLLLLPIQPVFTQLPIPDTLLHFFIFSKVSPLNLTQRFCPLPCPWRPQKSDEQTIWPSLSNFAESWRVSFDKDAEFNLNLWTIQNTTWPLGDTATVRLTPFVTGDEEKTEWGNVIRKVGF